MDYVFVLFVVSFIILSIFTLFGLNRIVVNDNSLLLFLILFGLFSGMSWAPVVIFLCREMSLRISNISVFVFGSIFAGIFISCAIYSCKIYVLPFVFRILLVPVIISFAGSILGFLVGLFMGKNGGSVNDAIQSSFMFGYFWIVMPYIFIPLAIVNVEIERYMIRRIIDRSLMKIMPNKSIHRTAE